MRLPVNITADSVEHVDASATLLYSGNVEVTQGKEITLRCDQLQLSRDEQNDSLITATGAPVIFEQSGRNGSSRGEASVVTYLVKQRLLRLEGSPLQFHHQDQQGNQTSGDALTANYDLHNERIEMSGSPIHIKHTKKSDHNKSPLTGEAGLIEYDLGSERLVMTGNAIIEQDGSKVVNDRIIFDLKQMNAVAGKKASASTRVQTTIRLDK